MYLLVEWVLKTENGGGFQLKLLCTTLSSF